jgi:hypothetical protein
MSAYTFAFVPKPEIAALALVLLCILVFLLVLRIRK